MMTATSTKTAKRNRFISAKEQPCTCIMLFCTFLGCRCTKSCDMKLPNFTLPLYGVQGQWTQHKNLFLFLNLDTVLSDSIPEKFANIWQIKWNRIRSIKFETVQIHFLSDVFGVLPSRNFATMATWRNDFSSLFFTQLSCSSHVGFLCWKLWLADFDSQVKNVKGQFVPAPPIEGTVLVNIADLMQRWTADKLKSSVRKLLVFSSLILFNVRSKSRRDAHL